MKDRATSGALEPTPVPPQDPDAAVDALEIAKDLEEYFEQRRETLKDIPYKTVRKAWFALSHLLLPDDARIAHMGCDDGTLTFCMAALAPRQRFIGIDKSKRSINRAKENYKLHNLDFVHGDVAQDSGSQDLHPQSLDGIINSFVLHEVFSSSRYSEETVGQALEHQFKLLKPGGVMFIHDYPRLNPEEFCLIEFPDKPSKSDNVADLSEADLLVLYSQQARPRHDPGCGGFFIEELPPRRPRTRLFRLPFKWAYEFILRKDSRSDWDKELSLEYTYFTMREYRKKLSASGARVQYSGPLWDEDFISEHFDGRFRLYTADGKPMDTPPTSYVAVAYKMPERKSLLIEERRPSDKPGQQLKISTMRNEVNGDLVDVVTPAETISEVLPYRVSSNGRLKIYLHDGVARGITNAVTRSGFNLDGKRWSGHLVEAIAVDAEVLQDVENFELKDLVKFSRDYLGLKPQPEATIIVGPDYYPAPDFIDEHIYTHYLAVQKHDKPAYPKKVLHSLSHFQSKGEVREFDAQQVLNAIAVGMIPNARLEMQILSLYNHLALKAENWTTKEIPVQLIRISKTFDTRNLLKQLAEKDHRFKEVKGTTGELRAIHSTFVEEGKTGGAYAGLHSHDIEFVISEENTINTAVVLPLTSNVKKDIHAGFLLKHLPVPQRQNGNGLTVSAPSFNIPPEVRDIKQMKKFIADKFGVTPDMVFKLGESYYSHIGITPQKIYPFGVAAPPAYIKDPNTFFIPIAQFRLLWGAIAKSTHMMTVLARSYRYLSRDIQYEFKRDVGQFFSQRLNMPGKTPVWSVPIHYESPPGKDAPGRDDDPKPDAAPELREDKKQLRQQSPPAAPAAKPAAVKSGGSISSTSRSFHQRQQVQPHAIAMDAVLDTPSPENAFDLNTRLDIVSSPEEEIHIPEDFDIGMDLDELAQALRAFAQPKLEQ